jgi:hypothetical protein
VASKIELGIFLSRFLNFPLMKFLTSFFFVHFTSMFQGQGLAIFSSPFNLKSRDE